MSRWIFLDYIDHRGTNIYKAWLESERSFAKKIDARLDVLLAHLSVQVSLGEPYLELYKGNEFTFLLGAVEKNDRLVPREAISIAERRREEVNAGTAKTEQH